MNSPAATMSAARRFRGSDERPPVQAAVARHGILLRQWFMRKLARSYNVSHSTISRLGTVITAKAGMMTLDRQQLIRARAYAIWEEDGRPYGKALEADRK
jgi:Protein of unknown function (DUF2934)